MKRPTVVRCCIVAHAAQNGHHQILVRTDVVMLAVIVATTLPAEDEVWITFGRGKHLRYFSCPPNGSQSESKQVNCSSYVSCIDWVRYCVSICWTWARKQHGLLWNSFSELTIVHCWNWHMHLLRSQNNALRGLLYFFTTEQAKALMLARPGKKLLAKTSSVQRILPTHGTLEQHVKRAIFQGGIV